MFRFFICSFLFLTLAACQPPPEPEKPKGLLRIATIPLDMPIIVDGQPKGNSPSGEGQYFSISLEEGEHKIEILKSIDEEKEQYASKTLFIAADTLPITTLEAKERFTPFGKQEKARREAEAAEKARLAKIERKKAAAIAAEKSRLAEIEKKKAMSIAAEKQRMVEAKVAEKQRLRVLATNARIILKGHTAKPGCTYCKRINFASFTSDTNKAVSSGQDQTTILWDLGSKSVIHKLKGHNNSVDFAVFSPDDRVVVTTSDKTMKLYDTISGNEIWSRPYPGSYFKGVHFSPDGKSILSVHYDEYLYLWDINSGKQISNFSHTVDVRSANYSQEARKLITATEDGEIHLWNSDTGEKISTIKHPDFAENFGAYAQISPDGNVAAIFDSNRNVIIYDLLADKKVREIKIPKSNYRHKGVNFSPTGRYLVTFGTDVPRVIEVPTGKVVANLDKNIPTPGNSGTRKAEYAEFSSDGEKIITPFYDQTVVVWDLQKELAAH